MLVFKRNGRRHEFKGRQIQKLKFSVSKQGIFRCTFYIVKIFNYHRSRRDIIKFLRYELNFNTLSFKLKNDSFISVYFKGYNLIQSRLVFKCSIESYFKERSNSPSSCILNILEYHNIQSWTYLYLIKNQFYSYYTKF